jgi:hypothetical protein
MEWVKCLSKRLTHFYFSAGLLYNTFVTFHHGTGSQ